MLPVLILPFPNLYRTLANYRRHSEKFHLNILITCIHKDLSMIQGTCGSLSLFNFLKNDNNLSNRSLTFSICKDYTSTKSMKVMESDMVSLYVPIQISCLTVILSTGGGAWWEVIGS